MDQPAVGTSLCERCSLLKFDDLAAGCREVKDKEGRARLSFADAKVEWRNKNEISGFKLIRLRWRLDDSLPHLPQLSKSSEAGCDFCNCLLMCLEDNYSAGSLSTTFSIHDGPISLTAYISLCGEKVEGLVVELVPGGTEGNDRSAKMFFPIQASPGKSMPLFSSCSQG